MSDEVIVIKSRDYWVKVVGMLQQNWALVDADAEGIARVYFIGDTSLIFDEMEFGTVQEAENGLFGNGFLRVRHVDESQKFLVPPIEPFRRGDSLSRPIYSSGQYWSKS